MGEMRDEERSRTKAGRSEGDTTVKKIDSRFSPRGTMGQKYLAGGIHISMRMWEDEEPGDKPEDRRPYETVGYVIKGRAELHTEGQMVLLEPGDSWVVPKGATHRYKVLEPFTAVEATSPPAQVHGRDEGEKGLRERGGGSHVLRLLLPLLSLAAFLGYRHITQSQEERS